MASTPIKESIRVFIDSSVLIAAAISGKGKARDLLRHGLRGHVTLVVSSLVFDETVRNLANKAQEALPALELLRESLELTEADPSRRLVLRVARVVEAKDAPIVAAAIKGQVGYLATYDQKHLLNARDSIRDHFGIIVARPDEILTFLS